MTPNERPCMNPAFHGRIHSEALLASLSLDDSYFRGGSRRANSVVSDEELDEWCPPLGKSVIEEEEERFASAALKALERMSPASSSSSSSAGESWADRRLDSYFERPSRRLDYTTSTTSSSSNSGVSTPASSLAPSSCCSPILPSSPIQHPSLAASISPLQYGIAFRRSVPLGKLVLPPPFVPPSTPASSPKLPRASDRRGVLHNNFGGMTTGFFPPQQPQTIDEDLDRPSMPKFRPKRATGFAF